MMDALHTSRTERPPAIPSLCRALFCNPLARFLAMLLLLVSAFPVLAAAEGPLFIGTIDQLRAEVADLETKAAVLETQNAGLRNMLRSMGSEEIYLVVDTENNRLFIRRGDKVLRTVVVSTGSRMLVKGEDGRDWFFESPAGSLTVLGKERNPVWIRPDWSYVEENMPIPDTHDPDRFVRDVLGKYALLLGNGYKIHGTIFKNLLGTPVTHGCVTMDDEDLAIVYKAAAVGTRVYIY